jgi:hypothetical protein
MKTKGFNCRGTRRCPRAVAPSGWGKFRGTVWLSVGNRFIALTLERTRKKRSAKVGEGA